MKNYSIYKSPLFWPSLQIFTITQPLENTKNLHNLTLGPNYSTPILIGQAISAASFRIALTFSDSGNSIDLNFKSLHL